MLVTLPALVNIVPEQPPATDAVTTGADVNVTGKLSAVNPVGLSLECITPQVPNEGVPQSIRVQHSA